MNPQSRPLCPETWCTNQSENSRGMPAIMPLLSYKDPRSGSDTRTYYFQASQRLP